MLALVCLVEFVNVIVAGASLKTSLKMMSLAPKKDGGPNTKFFESPETISLFDAIKSWLQKNCKKVRLNCRPFRRALLCGWLTCMDNRLSPLLRYGWS